MARSDFLSLFLPSKREFAPDETVEYNDNWVTLEGFSKQSIRRPCVRVYRDSAVSVNGTNILSWTDSYTTATTIMSAMPDWGMWDNNDPTKIVLPYTGWWNFGASLRFDSGGTVIRSIYIEATTPGGTLGLVEAGGAHSTPTIYSISSGAFLPADTYLHLETFTDANSNIPRIHDTPNMWAVLISRDLDG